MSDRILLMGKLTLDYLLPRMIWEYVQEFNDIGDDQLDMRVCVLL